MFSVVSDCFMCIASTKWFWNTQTNPILPNISKNKIAETHGRRNSCEVQNIKYMKSVLCQLELLPFRVKV